MKKSRMVGDTDPPKDNVFGPFSCKNSRTSRIESQREFSEAPAPRRRGLVQKETPTSAATGAGAYSQGFVKQAGIYQGRITRAIISYSVGADSLVQSFALVEVLA